MKYLLAFLFLILGSNATLAKESADNSHMIVRWTYDRNFQVTELERQLVCKTHGKPETVIRDKKVIDFWQATCDVPTLNSCQKVNMEIGATTYGVYWIPDVDMNDVEIPGMTKAGDIVDTQGIAITASRFGKTSDGVSDGYRFVVQDPTGCWHYADEYPSPMIQMQPSDEYPILGQEIVFSLDTLHTFQSSTVAGFAAQKSWLWQYKEQIPSWADAKTYRYSTVTTAGAVIDGGYFWKPNSEYYQKFYSIPLGSKAYSFKVGYDNGEVSSIVVASYSLDKILDSDYNGQVFFDGDKGKWLHEVNDLHQAKSHSEVLNVRVNDHIKDGMLDNAGGANGESIVGLVDRIMGDSSLAKDAVLAKTAEGSYYLLFQCSTKRVNQFSEPKDVFAQCKGKNDHTKIYATKIN